MADQQPGDATPAAGPPTDGPGPAPADAGSPADRAAGADRAHVDTPRTESSTVDVPARWSGSAAIPPPGPKRAWWSRRRTTPEPAPNGRRTTPEPAPNGRRTAAEPAASDDPTDWETTPPVDPWAGQDTPWDPMTAVPADLPPTRQDPGLLPPPPPGPGAIGPPMRRPAPSGAAPTGPSASGPPPTGPAELAPAQRRRWGRRKQRGTAGDGTAGPERRPAHPAAPGPPVATAGARPAPPASAAGSGGRAGRPPVPAARRPATAVPQPAWRTPTARPVPAPPAGRTPTGRPPTRPPTAAPWPATAPPRRRRWPRRLALVTLFGIACCCGIPTAYLNWAPAGQFPVTAVLPHMVGDLTLRDDSTGRQAAARLKQQLRDANAGVDDVFAGVYADPNGKRVTIFGTTGFRLTPKADVQAELRRLTDQFTLHDIQAYDLGETGVHERCGIGTADGSAVVVCAWADHGSLGTVVANRRSARDSATLTGILRSAVLTHG